MADQLCAHGKPFSDDCTECDLDAYARDMVGAEQHRKDFHRFNDPAYPERTCPVCGEGYRGPLSVCSASCERKTNDRKKNQA